MTQSRFTQTRLEASQARQQQLDARAETVRLLHIQQTIDSTLADLERFNLEGRQRIPLSWQSRLADLREMLEPLAASHLDEIRPRVSVNRLMDTLYLASHRLQQQRRTDLDQFGDTASDWTAHEEEARLLGRQRF